MTVDQLFFTILAFLLIASALMFVISKNMVHAVMYFLVAMLSMAGVFLLLNAPFLAATHVLVYAGAITVLILFVVMLTITRVPEVKIFGRTAFVGPLLAAVGFFAVLAGVVSRTNFSVLSAEASGVNETQTTAALGQEIFQTYLFPFEIAAFLLLIALVAAVYLAVGDNEQ